MQKPVIEVLGPVRAFVDGAGFRIGGPVDRGLLGVLAIRGGQRVAVSDILDAIYPGVPRSSAKRSLQSAVWRLRRALGDHAALLVTDSDGYRLDVEAADMRAMRDALGAARKEANRGRTDTAGGLLTNALESWRGRSPEIPRTMTEPADSLVADVVLLLAEILVAQGRPEDARVQLARLLEDQPDLDRAVALLEDATTRAAGHSPAPLPNQNESILAMALILGRCSIAELRAALAIWGEATASDRPTRTVPDAAAIVVAVDFGVRAGLLRTEGDPVASVSVRAPEAAADALGRIPAPQILEMHSAAATGLQRLHGTNSGPHLIAVAEHLLEATPIVGADVAVDALLAAASSAGTADPAAAVALLERAAETIDAWLPNDVDRQLAVLQATGAAHDALGEGARADDAWEQAIETAAAHDRPTALAYAALGLAGSTFRPRQYPRTRAVLENALSVLPPDDTVRSLVVFRRVQTEKFAPGGEPLADINAAANQLILAGMSQEDIAAQATIGLTRWLAGVEEGTATLDDDGDLAAMVAAAGDIPNLQHSWQRWAITRATFQGRFAAAAAGIAELAPRLRAWAAAARAAIERDELRLGRFASGIQLATLRAAQSRHAEARDLAEGVIAEVDPDATSPLVDLRIVLARFKAPANDAAGATELLRSVVPTLSERPIDQFRFATAIVAARVTADLSERSTVNRLLAELEPWRGRHCVIATSTYSGVTDYHLGRLRATAGDLDAADALLNDGLDAHRRVRAHVYSDLSRQHRADVLRQMGGAHRKVEADDLLAEVGRERPSTAAESSH